MEKKENELIWQKAKKGELPQDLTALDEIGRNIDALRHERDEKQKKLDRYYDFRNDPSRVIDPKNKEYAEMTEEDVNKLEKSIEDLNKKEKRLVKIYEELSSGKTEITNPELN